MLGNRRCAIPERAGRRDRPRQLGLAELGTERQHDLAVARGKPTAEFPHAGLVTEEADHPLIAGHRALVHLEVMIERDADPGVDRPVDLPVRDDPVAMRRPRSDGPAQAMAKTRA